jgi:hypothetical protein
MQMSKFVHRTERYFGSKVNIHTVSWKGQEDIDTKEIKKWCKKNFGNSGYDDETGSNRWLDNCKQSEIMLTRDEDLTLFLLRWE